MEINKYLTITNYDKVGDPSRVKYIVIHYVGAEGTAQNNCKYFYSTYRGASAHYFVGHDGDIWQCVDDGDIAWHCGASTYKHPECRNQNSIGIELCCRKGANWYFEDKTVEVAIELTKMLMGKYNVPVENVIRHRDVTGKNCPEPYVTNTTKHTWDDFKKQIADVVVNVDADVNVDVVGKEYKLVTSVNRYSSVSDAVSKTNSKGTYDVGTYYIYNKYPNGFNGMLNISKDSTGASAGSWINPSENVVKETPKEESKLYRVRKTKDDAKTQKGAYANLDGAIKCCQDAGEGYHVFDWDYNVVYSYKAPTVETPKEDVVVPVYDLDYPEKNKIVERDRVLSGDDLKRYCVKAIKGILANNSGFDVEIAKSFFTLSPKYDIDPMMVISQSVLETGWFKYNGSAVTAEQHNYCGLGVTSNGVTGGVFDTIEDGIRAQLQHLYAYGCKDALPSGEETILDPRFKYVTRGIAPYWQNLAGRWAVPGYNKSVYATPKDAMDAGMTYGQKIRAICVKLEAVDVTDSDIEMYFPVEKPIIPETPVDTIIPEDPVISENPSISESPVVSDTHNQESNDNVSYVFRMIRKLLESIVNFFKNWKE
jgi:N-acetylmuramoyl-L-alanine amidase CwlA